jgi:hypothetical protein
VPGYDHAVPPGQSHSPIDDTQLGETSVVPINTAYAI